MWVLTSLPLSFRFIQAALHENGGQTRGERKALLIRFFPGLAAKKKFVFRERLLLSRWVM